MPSPEVEDVGIVPTKDEKTTVAGYAGYLNEPDVHDAEPVQAPMLRWKHQGAAALDKVGGKFYNTLEGTDHPYDEITAVFINGKNSRAYYAADYDAKAMKAGASPPDCKSNDGVLGNGDYGPGSEGNPSGKCDACPMSKWEGSGRGAKPPPCALSYDRLIYDFHTHQVGIMSFGRSKINAIKDFQKALQAHNGGTVPMWGYKTRIFSEPRDNFHVPKIEILGVMPPDEAIRFRQMKHDSDQAFLRTSGAEETTTAEEDVAESDVRTTAAAY